MLWSLPLLPFVAAAVLAPCSRLSRPALGALACAGMAFTLLLALAGAAAGWTGAIEWGGPLRLSAALTPAATVVAALVPAVALPVLVWAAAHEDRAGLARLMALLLVFVGGMELLVIASDLLTLLIGWELVGACSWALIGHHWREMSNPRGGLYAFVMTRLGDLGLFAAAMAAFAGAGSFAYADLAGLQSPYREIVAFGVLAAAASKSGQVPFAPWLFRAMAGPTSVSALLHAATMVAAGAYILIRLHPVLSPVHGFAAAAIATGLATAIAGGIVALLQNHAKKLLAASTSAHYGLMFVAAGAGYPGVALLHLVAHAAFKALLFLAAGIAGARAGTFDLDRMGFGKVLRTTAALSAVGALALAGAPPLGGGWTKEMIVTAAGHASLWAAAGVMLAGGLSAAYAARFHLLAFARRDTPRAGADPGGAERAALATLAVLSLALSALWLPPVHDAAARLLAIEVPEPKSAETAASLLVLALGLLVGRLMAQRYPVPEAHGGAAAMADWLGLPSLIRAGATRPFLMLAGAAARFDDRYIDAAPAGVAGSLSRMAGATARFDDRYIDAAPAGVAVGIRALAAAFSREDRRIVDRGVGLAAAFAGWLARFGSRIGEAVIDGLPEGAARLAGLGGEDARRLQTGLAHHYYAVLAGGGALLIVILIAGS